MSRLRIAGLCVAVGGLAAVPATSLAQDTTAYATKKAVVTMSGSTSVAPLAAKLAKAYNKQFPGKLKFKLAQGGSDIGVADVGAGRVVIGNSSRDPKSSDPGGLVFNKIARDALCVVTNSANTLPDLSASTVQDVFGGKVRDWSQVPGASISGPINVNVRTAASGTQDAFQKLFLGAGKIFDGAAQKASNGLVQQAVRSDKQAIGYVSLAFAEGLRPVAFKGTTCTLRDAKSGAYQGARNFWMVTRGKATGAASRFIHWIQSSPKAAKVIASEWVPLR